MPLAPSLPMIEGAAREGRAVLAFNVSTLEMARGVVDAATAEQRPVIVQFNRSGVEHIGGVAVASGIVRALAEATTVPVALHLDHADTLEELQAAIAAGFTSLMIDGSTLSFADHLVLARSARELATGAGLPLEAELGHVAGVEVGVTLGAGTLTDPSEAARFVEETSLDLLAVSIGNVHGRAPSNATLDLGRLAQVRRVVAVPLVLHGASGVDAAQVAAAVGGGIAKINVGTGVRRTFDQGLRSAVAEGVLGSEALDAARIAVQRYAAGLLTASYAAE